MQWASSRTHCHELFCNGLFFRHPYSRIAPTACRKMAFYVVTQVGFEDQCSRPMHPRRSRAAPDMKWQQPLYPTVPLKASLLGCSATATRQEYLNHNLPPSIALLPLELLPIPSLPSKSQQNPRVCHGQINKIAIHYCESKHLISLFHANLILDQIIRAKYNKVPLYRLLREILHMRCESEAC
jgi:hypothetical protein